MSNLRVFWVIWCSMWALGWLLAGFLALGAGWLMVPVSLLAILLPVGSTRPPRPQLGPGWTPQPTYLPCGRCGLSFAAHAANRGWCPRQPMMLPPGR